MIGFLFFFFLFYMNVGKCNPIALMLNDICNEFWGIFTVVYESKCGGQCGCKCLHALGVLVLKVFNKLPNSKLVCT